MPLSCNPTATAGGHTGAAGPPPIMPDEAEYGFMEAAEPPPIMPDEAECGLEAATPAWDSPLIILSVSGTKDDRGGG